MLTTQRLHFYLTQSQISQRSRVDGAWPRHRTSYECSFGRLQHVKRVNAAFVELIMHDVHDGLGSQLVTTLHVVEKSGLSQSGRAAARMPRRFVAGLALMEPADTNLLAELVCLRYRMGERFTATGIRLDWRTADFPLLDYLALCAVLHILRIVQECFANALKHSQAGTLIVKAEMLEQAVKSFIEIARNRHGFRQMNLPVAVVCATSGASPILPTAGRTAADR